MKNAFTRAGIVGAGSWGTALGLVLHRNGLNVTILGNDPQSVAQIVAHRESRHYLPGVPLPETLHFTSDQEALKGVDLLLIVTPSRAVREVAARLSTLPLKEGCILISCTKGVERGSGLRMSEILAETLPDHPIAVLSGPSHAEEVAAGAPTAVVLGCADEALAIRLQSALNHSLFRTYTSPDLVGIELGGALKNIYAIAAGVSDGLKLGDNTKAALVTRALAELMRLGCALGGQKETFQGLSGMGDLMVTCFSKHSRNRAVGERMGRGESLGHIVSSMRMVAEGIPTTTSAFECARRLHVETPIIDHIKLLLDGALSPAEAMAALLARGPGRE
ncbi:MAG: NAD(P)-dependent glycerol-3-phosphate dehydrogenase [Verrucomicrobia bacterium]|nr:NAD(P)-dependent glycerol-3-phosphate dehydrogenase [Verrucomicrobiota bacterium]